MIDALKRLKLHMEREAQKVQEDLETRFDRVLRSQLEYWEARYPRHHFSAFYAHGLLNFVVEPRICGNDDPADLDKDGRGAIGKLAREANGFMDVWLGMQYRVEPQPLTAWIRTTDEV